MIKLGVMTRGGRLAAAMILVIVLASAGSSSRSSDLSSTSGRARAQLTGSIVQGDALGNTVIGGPGGYALAFRFRATWSGSIVAVRCYVIKNTNGRTGYSAGDGGIMRVALMRDSGRRPHVPVGRRLAVATFRPKDRDFWPLVRFRKPAKVRAGRLYHVVFSNVDPEPEHNYVSINALYSASRNRLAPAVPDGLAVLLGYTDDAGAAAWAPRPSRPREHYLPILDLVGGRAGQRDGQGYMEVWDPKAIGADAMVRELLSTPAGRPTQVAGAWLRVRRHKRTTAALVLRLESPDGRRLASASLAPRAVPKSEPGWVHARFGKPVVLAPRTDVALTASAADASSYEAFPIRKGTGFGFHSETFFDGGYAQFNDGNGWIGWDQWGGHDQRNSDLQFALDIVR